jgi:polyisoprenyl-phosphate glycosyltransferase
MRSPSARLSVVVPVFEERQCLPELHRRLSALDALPHPREVLFVDDASGDGSFELIAELAAADPRVRGVRLRHNVGSQRALLCGLQAARGDVLVTLDADLQHPPERVPQMLAAWQEGYDVVEMLRLNAGDDGPLRDLVTPLFYRLLNAVSAVPIAPRSTDFRLLDRRCVPMLAARPGELMRMTVARLAVPRTTLGFAAPPRFAGRSRYDLTRLMRTGAAALWSAAEARWGTAGVVAAPIASVVGTGL